MKENKKELILEVINLKTYFPIKKGILGFKKKYVKAVDNVSLEIKAGETFGIVGESGSGKSTLGKSIMRLVKPTSGTIKIKGKDITSLSKNEMFPIRKDVQIVFQDPYSSLNPRLTVGKIVSEGMYLHKICNEIQIKERLKEIFEKVGLSEFHINNYPHEFSGGQRQRISIARSLASRPRLLICDEPTSALDVSIQAQILNLLKDIQDELYLTMLFISHDLPVIRQMCNRIVVLKDGNVCEINDSEKLFNQPQHSYTKHLIDLMPKIESIV